MNAKHTPGPWMIFPDGRIGSEICTTTVLWPGALGERGAGNSIGEAMANARLIAVAPDLLAACEAAEHALRSYQYGNSAPDLAREVADSLHAAIAKARG